MTPMVTRRVFLTALFLIFAGVMLNGSALAQVGRATTPSGRQEETLLAQKAPEQKSMKAERIVAAIPVRALGNLPLLAGVKKGFYRQEGLEIDIVQMASTPDR